jgi:hypothetical protein
MSNMYFGPSVEKENKTELWHRDMWKESPLFGESSIVVDNGERTNNYCIIIVYKFMQLNKTYLKLKLHLGQGIG